MKTLLIASLLLPCMAFASGSKTKKFLVTITNTTKAQVLTVPVVALHSESTKLFEIGKPATAGLTLLAEDGGTSVLEDELRTLGRSRVDNYETADNNIRPGKSVQVLIKTKNASKVRLSLVSMLATTNDAFLGVQSVKLPRRMKEVSVGVYDAGTEFNSESCDTVPGPPCGSHNARDTDNAEGVVSEFKGLTGSGDIDLEQYGFSNMPATVRIEVLK
ncbi:MAG: hypothetical protein CME70_17220 [Halobacteriovorax sp.]|nr:hypothetical protein [Halobacteriovorax sp.]